MKKKEIDIDKTIKSLRSFLVNYHIPIEFRNLQKTLSSEQRYELRGNTKLSEAIFGIKFPKKNKNDYYFWDNTTLSLWEYLNEVPILKNKSIKIVELGCGPYATISLALKNKYPYLNIISSDILYDRVKNAKKVATLNKIKIEIIQSDLLSNIDLQTELIFMNPPYVSNLAQKKISGTFMKNPSEWKSGNGGIDGIYIISELLKTFKRKKWKCDTILMLGMNNYFVSNQLFESLVNKNFLHIIDRFKDQKICTPEGPYTQVYQIKR